MSGNTKQTAISAEQEVASQQLFGRLKEHGLPVDLITPLTKDFLQVLENVFDNRRPYDEIQEVKRSALFKAFTELRSAAKRLITVSPLDIGHQREIAELSFVVMAEQMASFAIRLNAPGLVNDANKIIADFKWYVSKVIPLEDPKLIADVLEVIVYIAYLLCLASELEKDGQPGSFQLLLIGSLYLSQIGANHFEVINIIALNNNKLYRLLLDLLWKE